MTNISLNDVLFASATLNGRIIANLRLRGVTSVKGLMAELRRAAGNVKGLVYVTLRNASRGWCRSLTLYMRAEEGIQLTLF